MYPIPILFLIYKNPSATKRVFDEIKKIKPSKLYIAADGPKDISEHKECSEVRHVTENIDWDCKIYRLYRDNNLGCKEAVSSAITWLFNSEDRAVILEYDCLPNQSFFSFCANMLEKYNDIESVMHICGSNFQDGIIRGDGSYYFSAITGVWGWATWKRSWACYNADVDGIEHFIDEGIINKLLTSRITREYWSKRFLNVKFGFNKSSWAIPWAFSVMNSNGVCIVPNSNLVSNIGFNSNATHAFDVNSPFSRIPTKDLGSILHPSSIVIDHEADNYATQKLYKDGDAIFAIIKSIIKKYLFPLLPKIVKNKLLEFNQNFLR